MIRKSHLRSGPALVACLLVLVFFAQTTAGNPAETPRGMTVPAVVFEGDWADDPADIAANSPANEAALPEQKYAFSRLDSTWQLVDSESFTARLPVGEACIVRFDHAAEALSVTLPDEGIIARAFQAIDYAPEWLAEDLRDIFRRLDSATQDTMAGLILASADPYVDETAFLVAHTPPQVLQSAGLYTELFQENAEGVYSHDSYLDYVDIVDVGSAASGGDYYSTVRYRTAEAGDTIEVTLPRERYYWDIVHFRITDEFPAYIDPATGAPTAPPTGKFWREFLFSFADPGYPVLRDDLAGCLTLWEGNVDTQVNGAVGILTGWVLDVLDFGSGAERPIQPVRIYRLHLGRCGEHADFTAAAARAALIATNSASAPDEDHTWNEFWDRRWVAWEPVNNYIDSGWHYEGWGKSFVGVFDWRGDDWTWTSTERYTPFCTLTVTASDSAGYPLDGALVRIGRKVGTAQYVQSTWGYTDRDGNVEFTLGDNQDLFVRIESSIGTFPGGSLYRKAVTASQPGQHYYYARSVGGFRPSIPLLPGQTPVPEWNTYAVRVTWSGSEYIYGGHQYTSNRFSDFRDGGAIEFFILPEEEVPTYQAGDSAYAYEIREEADSGDVTFSFPVMGDYSIVLSNEEHVVNKQHVSCTVELYKRQVTGVAGSDGAAPVRTALLENAPNPFNPSTEIPFTLDRAGRVNLAVYDVGGRLVKTLASGPMGAGRHDARWDGTDSSGKAVAAGVYLCRLETDGKRLHRKMLLVK